MKFTPDAGGGGGGRLPSSSEVKANAEPFELINPVPIYSQDFAARFVPPEGSLPVSQEASLHLLALPMHPYLRAEDQDRVISAVLAFNG